MAAVTSSPNSAAVRRFLPDLLFVFLLVLFVSLSLAASRQESVTIDEFRHLATGVHYWQSRDYSFDEATPPLWKMAMALPAYLGGAQPVRFREIPEVAAGWEPWFVATDFMRDNGAAYDGYLQSARLVNILAAAFSLLLLYYRGRRLFGPEAALFGTSFLALSPTMLAHSHYATTDVIATLTMLATVLMLVDYLHKPSLLRLAGASLLFSLSLLCKFSALLLVPLLIGVPLVPVFRRRGIGGVRRPAVALALAGLIVVLLPLLAVNGFYGFRGTGTALQGMHLESRSLAALATSGAGSLPIPLPRAFLEGFDKQKADSDFSEFPAYLNGRWSADGFRSYYLTAFYLKETLPFLAAVALALALLAWRRGWAGGLGELLLLAYVPVALLCVLSFMNRLNVGVRYLLPAYPFLCLFIAPLWQAREGRGIRLALALLLVLQLTTVLRVAPFYTSYFNGLAGGPANGYRHLIDSNIDWGQDLIHLRRYMADHGIDRVQLAYFGHGLPEQYGVSYDPLTLPPRPGYLAISVSLLQGHPYLLTYTDPPRLAEAGAYRSLQGLRPVGRAGYSMLIYKIDR
jgi:hypothetical protein